MDIIAHCYRNSPFALIAGIFRQRENVNLIMAEQKSQSVYLKAQCARVEVAIEKSLNMIIVMTTVAPPQTHF